MPRTSTVPAVYDALRALLAARPGLAGVGIFSVPVDEVTSGPSSIQFGPCHPTQVPGLLGNQGRDEAYDIACVTAVLVFDHSEAGGKASRDRAFALLAEVELALLASFVPGAPADALNSVARKCRVSSYAYDPEPGVDGYWAVLDFTIHVESRLTR